MSDQRAAAGVAGSSWRPSSVVEDRQVELAKPLGVSDQVDFGDLPADDREAEHDTRPPAWSPHRSRGTVDEHRLGEPGTPGEGASHGRRTAHFPGSARIHGCAICSEHDVWVEQRQQRVEVAAARGGEEASTTSRIPMAIPRA